MTQPHQRTKTPQPTSASEAIAKLAEGLRESVAKPNLYHYRPHDKQLSFHKHPGRVRLYIGGNRSGKTTGGVVEDCWWLRREHPFRRIPDTKIRGRVVAVDIIEGIYQILLPQFAQWLPPSALINGSWEDSWSNQFRMLTLANGSTCEFLTYEMETEKFAGTSRHFIHFDEEPPEDIYNECRARLIDTRGSSWITMTPLLGMTWIYEKVYEKGLDPNQQLIGVIEVDIHENPYLPPGEAELFLSGLSEQEREAREKGRFIQLGGLVYPKFDPNFHVVESRPIPKSWFVARSMDHGFRAPTAWLWHAVSPDGIVLTIREHYQAGLTVDEHSEIVHSIDRALGVDPDITIGDPATSQRQGVTGTSIAEEYARNGLYIVTGNNDVQAGLIRVARYIEPRTLPNDGSTLRSRWYVYPECANLIREMRRYRWKVFSSKRVAARSNEPEAPQKKDDHACDALRYFIMSRPDLSAGYYNSEPLGFLQRNPLGITDKNWGTYRVGDENRDGVWSPEQGTQWQDEMMGVDGY